MRGANALYLCSDVTDALVLLEFLPIFGARLQMAEDGDMEMRKMYGNPMVKVI